MRAAVFYEPNTPFIIEDIELDPPGPGEALVKIAVSGVCHSDYHLVTGSTQHPLPVVAGHEGAGVVEAVGPGVTRVRPGDHVVLSWVPTCGECFYCQHGLPAQCEATIAPLWAGTLLDGTTRLSKNGQTIYHFSGLGTFAEYAVVPQLSCVPIRRDVPLTVAALVGCAVTTGIGAALNTAQIRPGSSVVVFGCGGVGLNIIQGAALAGATTIIAVDVVPAKMDLARQFGATHMVNSREVDAQRAIEELTAGRGADYALEASGVPAVQRLAYDAIRRGGTVTYVGIGPHDAVVPLPAGRLPREDKTLKGSYYGGANPQRDMPMILDLYAAGRLKLDELISRRYPLAAINEAFAAMLSGEVARGVIIFD
ncbi:MAG: Zn-dependent alcohol dehydrogenase [Ardenticatenaceae bacterium]|nr:Zn-dependent alcohol dehydrogenase [Ardenticatenaceae bacterium]HBY99137.1 alcohol dehydrogenase [Chloroflexota bacterium]